MKLTPEQKLIEAAKLDGRTCFVANGGVYVEEFDLKDAYLHSYDAIIPLIQKQSPQIQATIAQLTVRMLAGGDDKRWRYFPQDMCHYAFIYLNATPSQLLDALLSAKGFEV